jgi:ribosomal protein S18 acetylase RimI-like enzyme
MYVLRRLEGSDYELFYPLINEFRETHFTKEEFEETLTQMKHYSDIWTVEYNSELIGTATIIYERKFIFNRCILAHIEDVCVKESYRRKGIGKLLVQKLIEEAKNKKCYKITLDCATHNIPFYTACGLETRGTQMTCLL